MLYPLWGFLPEDTPHADVDRFVDYSKEGATFFEQVPIEQADVAILPGEWRGGYPEAYALAAEAEKHGKPMVVFFNSDSDEEIPIGNAVVFRTSLFASRRKTNEFALPAWSRDFLKTYLRGSLPLRDKQPVPMIGYTGYVDYRNVNGYVKHIARLLRNGGRAHPGAHLRGTAVRKLSKSHQVHTRFILRSNCMTGSSDGTSREEYVRNIVETDYTLVVRGGGNFSYRFYEVLSCGRIPLFVNTDCVLPFDHFIDWKKHILWIEDTEIEAIGKKVAEFHASLSNDDFLELQRNARRLYEEWICPTGFFANLWRCLPGIKKA